METGNRKRLLIYAHYYYPDVAATGQLLMELAEGLSEEYEATVICAVPSYTGKVEERYRRRWLYREEVNGVRLLRVRVPPFSKRVRSSRIRNILAYAIRAMAATFLAGRQDYIFALSQPPVLGGLLGVWGKIWKGAGLLYSIQDFNPEQVMAAGYAHSRLVLKAMMALDCFCCRRAGKVVVAGKDMEETLRTRLGGRKVPPHAVVGNWADEQAVRPLPASHPRVEGFRQEHGLAGKFVIMYSGNMGLYYDLEGIAGELARSCQGLLAADGREVAFAFVGEGGSLPRLKLLAEELGVANMTFIPYQRKEDLAYSLNAADAHWCVSAAGLKGVSFPSKCYGIMAAGKPVLGVLEEGSGARELVEASGCGRCCAPGDYAGVSGLAAWCAGLAGSGELEELGARGRAYLEANLTKESAVRRYAEEIAGCGGRAAKRERKPAGGGEGPRYGRGAEDEQ